MDFKMEVVALIAVLICIVEGPLLFFSAQLERAKRRGMREYGDLAGRCIREFDAKWLRGGRSAEEPLIGSADIQSLADMGGSLEMIESMRITLASKESVTLLFGAVVLPVVPLLLTLMPIDELMKKLFGIIF